MMLLVHLTQQSGVYDYVAIRAGQLARGEPFRLDDEPRRAYGAALRVPANLTMILLIVPITFLLADALDIDPVPR